MGTVNWGKAQGDVAKPEPAQGLLVAGGAGGHSLQGYQPAVGQQSLSQGRGTLLLDHIVLQAARREQTASECWAGGISNHSTHLDTHICPGLERCWVSRIPLLLH